MKTQKTNLLCIFSRFPQAGRCKTRLTPQLGARGAAHLQRQMTEHIIRVGQQSDCDLLLCLDGGTSAEISSWLGDGVDYVYQQGAGLGERMANGFDLGFARQYQKVLLVGADCPSIGAHFLDAGFAALAGHDLVLGPTTDGGYYLIGMKADRPELFAGIAWGTSQVMAQTMAAAQGLTVLNLPTLTDIDAPEDLHVLPSFLQVVRG